MHEKYTDHIFGNIGVLLFFSVFSQFCCVRFPDSPGLQLFVETEAKYVYFFIMVIFCAASRGPEASPGPRERLFEGLGYLKAPRDVQFCVVCGTNAAPVRAREFRMV